MPRPKTRKGRFWYYRQRHIRRREKRRRKTQLNYLMPGLVPVRVDRWQYNVGEKMVRPDLATPEMWKKRPPFQFLAAGTFVLPAITNVSPPHPRVTSPEYLRQWANGTHQRVWWSRLFARSIRLRTRRAGRLNGVQRQNWYAVQVARRTGYYPDWDPQSRRPNTTDGENGVPELPFYIHPLLPHYPRYYFAAS